MYVLKQHLHAQRWKVTKNLYSSTVHKYSSEVLVLYLSTPFFCYLILLLHYISEATVTLHVSDNLDNLVTNSDS